MVGGRFYSSHLLFRFIRLLSLALTRSKFCFWSLCLTSSLPMCSAGALRALELRYHKAVYSRSYFGHRHHVRGECDLSFGTEENWELGTGKQAHFVIRLLCFARNRHS